MPNYVRNRLEMKGIATLPLFKTTEGGAKRFDFNKIIRMPKSLNIVDGSETDWAIAAALQKLCKAQFRSGWGEERCHVIVQKDFFKEEDREKLEKAGMIYISNYIKYGYPTWYGWCINNWGTKWNACETEIITDDVIEFETAWSNPEPIVKKLAKKYPDRNIHHEWSDEDYGSNCGQRDWNGKEWTEIFDGDMSEEAKNRYERLWGVVEDDEDEE